MSKQDFEDAAKRRSKPTSPPPFSIWFSWPQRDELERLSNGEPWATYIKRIIFSGKFSSLKKTTFNTLDRQLIAKLLGALGQSRLASNVNQLAKAVNTGSLQVNDEVQKAILEACRSIQWMRATLIEALGLKAHEVRKSKGGDAHEDTDDPER